MRPSAASLLAGGGYRGCAASGPGRPGRNQHVLCRAQQSFDPHGNRGVLPAGQWLSARNWTITSRRWRYTSPITICAGSTKACGPRQPPACSGLTDRAWSLGDLIDAALAVASPDPTETAPERRRKFRVIKGENPDKSVKNQDAAPSVASVICQYSLLNNPQILTKITVRCLTDSNTSERRGFLLRWKTPRGRAVLGAAGSDAMAPLTVVTVKLTDRKDGDPPPCPKCDRS